MTSPAPQPFTGSVGVGTSAAAVGASSQTVAAGVQLKADPANTGTIYVGFTSGVTAGTAGATDGFPLKAGDTVFIAAELAHHLDGLYAIASAASQKLYFLGW